MTDIETTSHTVSEKSIKRKKIMVPHVLERSPNTNWFINVYNMLGPHVTTCTIRYRS